MKYINESTVGKTWAAYIDHVLTCGTPAYDAREDILEAEFVQIELHPNSAKLDEILDACANKKTMSLYREKMFSKELIPEFNSTYGDRLFDIGGFNQIEDAVNRLKKNKWAKSCFVPLVIPNDPGPRIPCLSALQLAIRNDRLLVFATFRSQNVFNSYGNFLGLLDLQKYIADKLDATLGSIYISINFPHIYKSDIEKSKIFNAAIKSGDLSKIKLSDREATLTSKINGEN